MVDRVKLGIDVFNEAIRRMYDLYSEGHRIMVSTSSGKDSTVCIEICRIAARMANALPVEAIMRDEEILYPGSFEYMERLAVDPEIKLNWVYANQPVLNVFNRECPYFWVFDPLLPPEEWVRTPPPYAYKIPDQNIERLVTAEKFPPAPGKKLYNVIGLRTDESVRRLFAIYSSKGYLTGENKYGVTNCRPIYDWTTTDVWTAIEKNKWDYNEAYDVFAKFGVKKRMVRIAPVSMSIHGTQMIEISRRAWPRWFDKVDRRLPGFRAMAKFGKRAVTPNRKPGETWEETYRRECIALAPDWIAARATTQMETMLRRHAAHSTLPFPQVDTCDHCKLSWKSLCYDMYNGDPFSQRSQLPYVEPEFFRQGAGYWGGSPSF